MAIMKAFKKALKRVARFLFGVKIDVDQQDIDEGVPGNPVLCPIARAARRALEFKDPFFETRRLSVDGFYIDIHHYTSDFNLIKSVEAPLPLRARRFVADFDCHFDIARPFSFRVRL
jgi:hypothetical protein